MPNPFRRGQVCLLLSMLALSASCASRPSPIPPTPGPEFTATPIPSAAPAPSPTALGQTSAAGVPTTSTNISRSGLAANIDAYLRNLAAKGGFSGAVLVAAGNGILLSQGYGMAERASGLPNTPTTRFRLGSLTKQFTAMAILLLQQQGKLDVGDSICNYLSHCPAAWQPITIHHLLTHTSGIPDLTRFPDFEATKQTPSPPEATIARFAERPLAFRPGTRWDYSNSNYILLGSIIEQATGQPYADFMQQAIFVPLGMRDSGYETSHSGLAAGYIDRSAALADAVDMSIPYAAGALYSTVEDLYRWDQALASGQLVSQDLLDQMFAAHAAIPNSAGASYGYGWEIGQQEGHPYQAHAGGIEGFSSFIFRFPGDRVTVIVLGNQQDVNPRAIASSIAEAILAGRPLPASSQ